MSHLTHIRDALSEFLRDDDTSVIAINGAWGVGKTYFWNGYLQSIRENNIYSQVAYAYISLFGINSIEELREKIFQSSEPLVDDQILRDKFTELDIANNKLTKLAPWTDDAGNYLAKKYMELRDTAAFLKKLPGLKSFTSIVNAAEYKLVNNYLICFDDIERKGNNLSISEFMGLVDELSVRKDCKIVIILNEDSLPDESAKAEYDKYREKVIDINIKFCPTIMDNLSIIFRPTHPAFDAIHETSKQLNLSNIRVLRKINWVLNKLVGTRIDIPERLLQELAQHICVLRWSYYDHVSGVNLNAVEKFHDQSMWFSILEREDDALTDEEKKWKSIESEIGYIASDFDQHIINTLRTGVANLTEFNTLLESSIADAQIANARDRLHRAWDFYKDSFRDNVDEFINAIREVLDNDIDKLGIWEFSGAIDVMEDFDHNTESYINAYLDAHSHRLADIDPYDNAFGKKINNQVLLGNILEARSNADNDKNIDDVLDTIINSDGWGHGDLEFLNNLSVDEIESWMMSSPDNLVKKIRRGLLSFGQIHTSDADQKLKFTNIQQTTTEALKRIGSSNQLNRIRVENIYGVKVNNDASGDATN